MFQYADLAIVKFDELLFGEVWMVGNWDAFAEEKVAVGIETAGGQIKLGLKLGGQWYGFCEVLGWYEQ